MLRPMSRSRAQIFLQQSAEFLRQHPDLVATKDAPKPAAADGHGKPGSAEEEGWDISYGERKDQARLTANPPRAPHSAAATALPHRLCCAYNAVGSDRVGARRVL